MAAKLLVIVLSLSSYRSSLAVQCFVGQNTAMAVKVLEPLCGFRIFYENDTCVSDANVELTVEFAPNVYDVDPKLKQMFKYGVCYYDNTDSLTCICYGHLCNDATHIKEILAMELARGALTPARRMITCFLFRDEISAVFGLRPSIQYSPRTPPTEDLETSESTESSNTWESTLTTLPWWSRNNVNKNKDDDTKEDGQDGNDDLYMIMYLTVAVLALLLICLIILFLIMSMVNIAQRGKVMKSIKDQEGGKSSSKSRQRSGGVSSRRKRNKKNSSMSGEAEAAASISNEALRTAPNQLRSSPIRRAPPIPHKEPDLYKSYSHSLERI